MHVLSEDGTVAATVVLAMMEVVFSATGGMGWEDVGLLAAECLNFDMSIFPTFCFFSFSGAGIGASFSWIGIM